MADVTTAVTRDQFDVTATQATHRPTGAKICWATLDNSDFHFGEKGRVDEVLENLDVYEEREVFVLGMKLLMELFAKRRMMDDDVDEPDGLTDAERAALEILKGAGVGRHVALPTLLARWGSRRKSSNLLQAVNALVEKGLAEASSDRFTFAAAPSVADEVIE
jgi:hypothetical protein